MTNPPNEQPDPWAPPDPSRYPPPPTPSGPVYPGGTPGVYDSMSAPPAYTPPFPDSPPSGAGRRPDNSGPIIGVVIGGVCLVAIIGVVVFLVARPDDGGSTAAEPEPGASSAAGYESGSDGTGPGPSVDPKADIQGDGTYLIGSELAAGEYATTVPDSAALCYWERLKGTSGEFDDIIANGVADPGEKVTVTIEAKDEAFKTQGCGSWVEV